VSSHPLQPMTADRQPDSHGRFGPAKRMIVSRGILPIRATLLAGIALLVSTASPRAEPPPRPSGRQTWDALAELWTSGVNLAKPPGFPEIGKWMLAPDGGAAHWLGEVYEGKRLQEPINVILVVEGDGGAGDATRRVLDASAAAGYPVRFGHSAGYRGSVGGRLYGQLPRGRDDAFSNGPFEFSNNHGRIFGPHKLGEAFVFVAAFSREAVDPFRWPGHRFASFNAARDDFTQKLDRATPFKIGGFVSLDNALVDDPAVTTGDHDGLAVLVRAAK
jgi:hypothetical protein